MLLVFVDGIVRLGDHVWLDIRSRCVTLALTKYWTLGGVDFSPGNCRLSRRCATEIKGEDGEEDKK